MVDIPMSTTKQHRDYLGLREQVGKLVPVGGMNGRIEDLERHMEEQHAPEKGDGK